MTKEETQEKKEILEKQLQLLSEASEKAQLPSDLAQLTAAIILLFAVIAEL